MNRKGDAMIRYLKGDATSPQAKGPKIIAHVCNTLGGWGKGFVLAVSKRWVEPERLYRAWHHVGQVPTTLREGSLVLTSGDFGLGQVMIVQVLHDTFVLNMIAQKGLKTGSKGPPIRYEALATCLVTADQLARDMNTPATLHMPRIGTGLAGGTWDRVEPLLAKLKSDVYVYDYNG
jgi:O-acetyl-ADP-ribose deacetylase (regulator of RNase III)